LYFLTFVDIIFDDWSYLKIAGVGKYQGPINIANYLAIALSNVSNLTRISVKYVASKLPSLFFLDYAH
jgi:hypothetical protein